MRKLLMFVLIISFTSIVKANEPISPITITETFYGTKLSNRANNPCKGETIKVCAIRYTTHDKVYNTTRYILYEKTIELRDENEITFSITKDYVEVPIDTTIQALEGHNKKLKAYTTKSKR